jgi:hypothetical protein
LHKGLSELRLSYGVESKYRRARRRAKFVAEHDVKIVVIPVEVWTTIGAIVETITMRGSGSKEDQVKHGEACQGARPAASQGL